MVKNRGISQVRPVIIKMDMNKALHSVTGLVGVLENRVTVRSIPIKNKAMVMITQALCFPVSWISLKAKKAAAN